MLTGATFISLTIARRKLTTAVGMPYLKSKGLLRFTIDERFLSMMPTERETDADFYNLMHEMGNLVPDKKGAERRSEARSDFPSIERIAALRGPDVPDESEFFEVKCRDLTKNGFSFFLPDRPDFDLLVVALGKPPALTYFAARVVRVAETEQDGKPSYLVGCRFSGRVHL